MSNNNPYNQEQNEQQYVRQPFTPPQHNQPYAGHANAGAYQDPRTLFPSLWGDAEDLAAATRACLARVFLRMFCALCVTALVAYGVYYSLMTEGALAYFIFSNSIVFYGIMIAQLAVVMILSFRVMKMSSTVSNVMFFAYAALTGLTMSVIFLGFSIGVIFQAFVVTAMMFGAMALFGSITKMDLSKIGGICMMALIGIIIASFVNFFFQNDAITMIINYVGVLVFVGLTAYDTQHIKRMLEQANSGADGSVIVADRSEAIKRITVIGALKLYLDFINLFLKILSIMGRKR